MKKEMLFSKKLTVPINLKEIEACLEEGTKGIS